VPDRRITVVAQTIILDVYKTGALICKELAMPNTPLKVALSLCTALSIISLPVPAIAAGKQQDPPSKPEAEKPSEKLPPQNAASDKQVPPPSMDTNKDGKPDAWDRDANGTPDAWDINGDGQPDKVDNNGDGRPDDDTSSPEPSSSSSKPVEPR
jgi:hypothetical protein